MSIKHFLTAALAVCIALVVGSASAAKLSEAFDEGDTWYVDANAPEGGNGTKEKPFKKVTDAIAGAKALDKIEIAEGTYECTKSKSTALGATHLYIDKKLYLKGAGRDKTRILGVLDPSGDHGIGSKAVRCLTVSGAAAAGCLFEEISFEEGSTDATGNYGSGGAYCDDGAVDVCFAYCAFRNCSANVRAGGAGGGRSLFVGCLFLRNYCPKDGSGAAIGKEFAGCYNCIFMYNECGSDKIHILEKGTSANLINCTFLANLTKAIPDSVTQLGTYYNTVFLCSYPAQVRSAQTTYNCCSDVWGSLRGGFGNQSGGTQPESINTNLTFVLFSPLTFDFRPDARSGLAASGDVEGINGDPGAWIPGEYRNLDYERKPRFTIGADEVMTVSRGAVEETFDVPECAPTILTANMEIDGFSTGSDSRNLWFRTEKWPSSVYLKTTAEEFNDYYFSAYTSAAEGFRIRDLEDGIWYMPRSYAEFNKDFPVSWKDLSGVKSSVSDWVSYTEAKGGVKWVGKEKTDPKAAYGTRGNPYATIQDAVDAVGDYGVVKVLPGTYDQGGREAGDGRGFARVVCEKPVTIIGVEGPEKTIVVGKFNSDVMDQRTGPNAIRGIDCAGTSERCAIIGITITGCSTQRATQSDRSRAYCSCAVVANLENVPKDRVQVGNCIVSNNYAFAAPFMFGGWATRCIVAYNHQEVPNGIEAIRPAAIGFSYVTACKFYGNAPDGKVAVIGDNSYAVNCTVSEFGSIRVIDDASKWRINNIFYGGGVGPTHNYAPQVGSVFVSNICWKTTGGFTQDGYAPVADPLLVDPDGLDWRLMSLSPAYQWADTTRSEFRNYVTGLMDGAPIVDGKTVVGCYRESVACCVTSADMIPSGTNVVDSSGQIVIKAKLDRPLLGYSENGSEEFIQPTGPERSIVWTATDMSTSSVSYVAVYGTNWYVNATRGSDITGTGYTPSTATKTFASLFSHDVRSGDVVHAAEGTYDTVDVRGTKKGDAVYYTSKSVVDLYCRVKVPDGVTLKADGRREKTVIKGRWHSSDGNPRWGPVYGSGTITPENTPNYAVRGVMLGHNSVLDGFTVENGCATGSAGQVRDDNSGGGVIGFRYDNAQGPSYVRNCTIHGGGSRDAAGIAGCVVESCYLYNHTVTSYSSDFYNSRIINCLVKNSSNSGIGMHLGIYGSTFIETSFNNSAQAGPYMSVSEGKYAVVNSIIITPDIITESVMTHKNWHNNIISWKKSNHVLDSSCDNIRTNTLEECGLDANNYYKPLEGSIAIDTGDMSWLNTAKFGDVSNVRDFVGIQRVYNGQVDLGCHELDMRPKYRDDLKHYKIAVAEASPLVYETEDRHVRLENGTSLVIKWPGSGSTYVAYFDKEGSGTLTVTNEDGVIVGRSSAEGEGQNFRIKASGDDTELTFTYEGEGGATLMPFYTDGGALIIYM